MEVKNLFNVNKILEIAKNLTKYKYVRIIASIVYWICNLCLGICFIMLHNNILNGEHQEYIYIILGSFVLVNVLVFPFTRTYTQKEKKNIW